MSLFRVSVSKLFSSSSVMELRRWNTFVTKTGTNITALLGVYNDDGVETIDVKRPKVSNVNTLPYSADGDDGNGDDGDGDDGDGDDGGEEVASSMSPLVSLVEEDLVSDSTVGD